MIDDDFGETDLFGSDYVVEQRATERHLADLSTNGFRDARQKYSEDERLIQIGFDIGYQQLVKLAFLTGQLRSICANSARLKQSSAFLAMLNHKLDKLEKLHYEKLLNWKVNAIVNNEMEPCLADLSPVIVDLESRLNQFKKILFDINGEKLDMNEVNARLDLLNLDQTVDERVNSRDESESGATKNDAHLNDLMKKSFNI